MRTLELGHFPREPEVLEKLQRISRMDAGCLWPPREAGLPTFVDFVQVPPFFPKHLCVGRVLGHERLAVVGKRRRQTKSCSIPLNWSIDCDFSAAAFSVVTVVVRFLCLVVHGRHFAGRARVGPEASTQVVRPMFKSWHSPLCQFLCLEF